MTDFQELLQLANTGFQQVNIADEYKQSALKNLELWLTDPQYIDYLPQLEDLILKQQAFDYLLDCFYQIIPFGTAGRRGEVGPGPNRINPATIKSSAQGHSQYLLKTYGEVAKTRGVVLCYDVRVFPGNKFLDAQTSSPLHGLTSRRLAEIASQVYAANGLLVYIFDDVRATPELSFAIRHLQAVGGDVFSASHNPPEHNGKKVFDEHGGQLIPPYDEELVAEVTQNVTEIHEIDFADGEKNGIIKTIGSEVDQAYWQALKDLSLSSARGAKIAYTPLHGTGLTSLYPVLKDLGFDIELDPKTSNLSGLFENVTFQIPNPEVLQSFETVRGFADQIKADIILNTDPDADRIGIMIRHQNQWQAINGNEICAVLAEYAIQKKRELNQISPNSLIVKTEVTSNLVAKIATDNNLQIHGDLLVGFKYIADEMNKLEATGHIDDFLFGAEESHGYIFGNYCREKDAAIAGLYLAELASELKEQGLTIIDYLEDIYVKYGYYLNYVSEIRMPGAEGMVQIQSILKNFRAQPPTAFGDFQVTQMVDFLDRLPIVSETDRGSKNAITFNFQPPENCASLRVIVRPSGTEPKIKMYFEVSSHSFEKQDFSKIKNSLQEVKDRLEKDFMITAYNQIGIDFPERGFLLFWQMPIQDKMKYFEIEPQIVALKDLSDSKQRQLELDKLLAFLGGEPIMKVDSAFKAEYGQGVLEYLNLV